jgi:hypothetical protein
MPQTFRSLPDRGVVVNGGGGRSITTAKSGNNRLSAIERPAQATPLLISAFCAICTWSFGVVQNFLTYISPRIFNYMELPQGAMAPER